MAYEAKPTLAGQAALTAALNNEGDITISQLVVGDGNGNPTTPLETQPNLVNLRATVPVTLHTRDGNVVTFEGTLDENTGGFVIREAGLLDENGVLLFVANIPATEKLTTAENAFDILTIGLMVVISDTANVALQPPPGDLVSIADMIRAPHITVDTATTNAPPGIPADDSLHLVPANATGAWAGHAHQLAQWNGEAWLFKSVPVNHLIGVASSNPKPFLRRTLTGWEPVYLPDFKVDRAALLFFGSI